MEKKRAQLVRGSPITDYSPGPDSSSREVTPRKMEAVADELAVIREERERGTEAERNWNPMEPTPSPAATPAVPILTQQAKSTANTDATTPVLATTTTTPPAPPTPANSPLKTLTNTNAPHQHPDGGLYEGTSKARPARVITPEPGTQKETVGKTPVGPKGACHGCGKKGHSAQQFFRDTEKERRQNSIMQKRPFDQVQDRTPRRGLGQPKGQGPNQLRGQQPSKPGSSKPLYRAKPALFQQPAREYKQASKVIDNRPPGRVFQGQTLDEARIGMESRKEIVNQRILIYLSKVKAPPRGVAKWWKDEMRRKITQTVEKEMGVTYME